jgi:hypothetical protein
VDEARHEEFDPIPGQEGAGWQPEDLTLGERLDSPEQGGERAPFEPQPDGPVEDREARLVGEDADVILDRADAQHLGTRP